MKKNIYFISSWLVCCLLTVVLITSSCTSCSGAQPLVDITDSGVIDAGQDAFLDANLDSETIEPSKETTKLVRGDTWSIMLPLKSEVTLNPEKDIAFTSLTDDVVYLVVILTKEVNTDSYDSFVISGIRGAKAAGTEIVKTETIISNSSTFTLVESEKDDVSISTWLGFKNNTGYGLSCAGAVTDELVKDVCLEVFKSLQLL